MTRRPSAGQLLTRFDVWPGWRWEAAFALIIVASFVPLFFAMRPTKDEAYADAIYESCSNAHTIVSGTPAGQAPSGPQASLPARAQLAGEAILRLEEMKPPARFETAHATVILAEQRVAQAALSGNLQATDHASAAAQQAWVAVGCRE